LIETGKPAPFAQVVGMSAKANCLRSVLVSVMVADPRRRGMKTALVPALRNQVEVLVGGVHHV